MFPIKPARPLLLHLQAAHTLGFALFDAQLLEEDVSAIEDGRLGSGIGTLHVAESGNLGTLDLGGFVDVQLGKHVTAELSLGHAGLLKVGVDLASHVVACVIDGNRVGLLAFEMDVTDINSGAGSRNRNGSCSGSTSTGRSWSSGSSSSSGGGLLGTLDGELQTCDLALLEELPGTIIGGIVEALVRPMLAHEAVEGLHADADLLAKGRLGHGAAVEEACDLASDLITVLRSGHILDIDIVQVDRRLFW